MVVRVCICIERKDNTSEFKVVLRVPTVKRLIHLQSFDQLLDAVIFAHSIRLLKKYKLDVENLKNGN